MATTVPSWFDLNYYLSQKVEQMNNTQYGMDWLKAQGSSNWTKDLVLKHINGWPWQPGQEPIEGDTPAEKAYSNFLACNADHYTVNVGLADINVSGTPLFDVAVYLQNLANYHNSQNPNSSSKATIQTELQACLAAKTSAWGYFQEHWTEIPQVNPSNNFDLSAYIAERAKAEGTTPAQIIADIEANGETPIEDFTDWGPSHGMNIAPKPATSTQPEISSDWSIWGKIEGSGDNDTPTPTPTPAPTWSGDSSTNHPQPTPEPEPTDPYDQNVTTVKMAAGQTAYTGTAGENTRFEAKAGGDDATLDSKTVITGGEGALNTLAVDLSSDWEGFAGVSDEESGKKAPSVTNVGRIALSYAGGEEGDPLSFNASNISDDAVRYDLDSNNNAQTISLTNLGSKVEEVRISNVAISEDKEQTTEVAFAAGNAPEEMTLVVDNVSPTAVNAIDVQNQKAREVDTDTTTNYSAMNFKAEGIETLTVQAEGSASSRSVGNDYTSEMKAANSIDLGQCGSLNTLKIGGTGDIALWDLDASKISIDASAATGNVTLGVKNLTDKSIIGGSGRDMISFDTEAANVTRADWTGIEDVLMRKGGYIDASGVTGLRELWNLSSGETCEIANLTADDFYICGAPTWGENIYQHVKVNGNIGNLTWTSAERGESEQYFSTLESNAKGNFHLNIGNKDILASDTGDGKYFSNYTLPDLQGNITVNIANATPGGAGLHITAPQAKSLEMNAVGSLYFGGDTDLASVEALTLNLQSTAKESEWPDKFSLSDNNGLQVEDHGNGCLQSVNQIDISGGYCDVTLGNIGGSQNNGIDINTNEIQTLNISGITVSENSDIRMQLHVNEAQIGGQATPAEDCQGVSGGRIDIDASSCNGMCRIDNMQAAKGINYVGGDNGDYQYADDDTDHTGRNFGDVVTVTRLGANSGSNFELGGGSDTMFIHLANTQNADEMAEVNVTLGAGSDFLGVGFTSGLLRVNVKDYTSEDEMSVIQSGLNLDEAKVQDFFARFGMKVADDDMTLFEVAVGDNGLSTTAVEYNNDIYLFSPGISGASADSGLTMTVLEGLAEADAGDIHLR